MQRSPDVVPIACSPAVHHRPPCTASAKQAAAVSAARRVARRRIMDIGTRRV
jgi:hypothetical protein